MPTLASGLICGYRKAGRRSDVPSRRFRPPRCHLPATCTVMRLEWRPCVLVAAHSYSPPWLPRAPATLSVLLLLDRPMLSAPGGARQLIWAGGQASARQINVKFPPGRTPPGGDAASSATTGLSAGGQNVVRGLRAGPTLTKCPASAQYNLRPPLLECAGGDPVSHQNPPYNRAVV